MTYPWLSASQPAKDKLLNPETLRFTLEAWLKVRYLCQACPTEIGGFGVTGDPKDPLLVTDFVLPTQECTAVSVDFDPVGVSDLIDELTQGGLAPYQCQRVWIHTHPGTSPNPSGTDEQTFGSDQFDRAWAVMYIMAKGGEQYARLRVGQREGEVVGPVLTAQLRVDIDPASAEAYFTRPGEVAARMEGWKDELKKARTRAYGFAFGGGSTTPRREYGGYDPTDTDAYRSSRYGHGASVVKPNGFDSTRDPDPVPRLPRKQRKRARELAKTIGPVFRCETCKRWAPTEGSLAKECGRCQLVDEIACRLCRDNEPWGLMEGGVCLECLQATQKFDADEYKRRTAAYHARVNRETQRNVLAWYAAGEGVVDDGDDTDGAAAVGGVAAAGYGGDAGGA